MSSCKVLYVASMQGYRFKKGIDLKFIFMPLYLTLFLEVFQFND